MRITFKKTKNQNSNIQKIRIFLKDSVGNDIQIDLKPGEFVYSEINQLTNSLRVYLQKETIKIDDVKKPENLQYYIGYSKEIINMKNMLVNNKPKSAEIISEKKDTEDVISPTDLDIIKKQVKEYEKGDDKASNKPSKPPKKKKGKLGRPKKRGRKKGSKNKK